MPVTPPLDNDAFVRLIDEHQRMVYSIVLQVVGTHELAQEVAQDAFVKIYFAMEKFDNRSKLSTWIYRIAYNTAISAKRRLSKTTARSIDDINQLHLQIPDTDYDPMRERQLDQLNKILATLAPDDNLIITLYYYENHSIDDISQILGLSVSNTKVRLHRIRSKMHQMFEKP